MKYSIDKKETYTIITIDEKKLDTTVAPDLKSEFVKLNAEGINNLILDLGNVKYTDSSGLSSILIANRVQFHRRPARAYWPARSRDEAYHYQQARISAAHSAHR